MVNLSRARAAFALSMVAFVVTACGSLVGIEDRTLGPGATALADSGSKPDSSSTTEGRADGSGPVDSGSVIASFVCGDTQACTTPSVCCISGNIKKDGNWFKLENNDTACVKTCTSSGNYTTTLRCAKSADCQWPQVCCIRGDLNWNSVSYSGNATCSDSCNGGELTFQLCESKTDCVGAGETCVDAYLFPGFKRCR